MRGSGRLSVWLGEGAGNGRGPLATLDPTQPDPTRFAKPPEDRPLFAASRVLLPAWIIELV